MLITKICNRVEDRFSKISVCSISNQEIFQAVDDTSLTLFK